MWKGSYFPGVNKGGAISWTQARAEAQALGGDLGSFATLREELTATAAVRDAGVIGHFWIGLTDVALADSFVWITGQPLRYLNWNAGEPNNNYAGQP